MDASMPLTIESPTLLLKPSIAKRNIATMQAKANAQGVRFRPHFKTHQSAGVGEWFREAGIESITVSSINMARYFAQHGWQDITIAFPVNWRQINDINQLAASIKKLNLVLESVETIEFLQANLTHPVDIWLKVDTGYHRTGVVWDDVAHLESIASAMATAPKLTFVGVLTHSGHSYRARGKTAIQAVYDETVTHLQVAKATLGIDTLQISIGDTPTCTVAEDFSGVDEIRPGNFVFYDTMQTQIGSCGAQDIAVGVACPVVAKHPQRNTVIVHGGTVHFSSDFLAIEEGRSYGLVAPFTNEGWGDPLAVCYVQGLAQEHGIIHVSDALMPQIQIGDLLVVLPVHSCLTVDLYKHYVTPSGEMIAIGKASHLF